jgi:hypothetical protein
MSCTHKPKPPPPMPPCTHRAARRRGWISLSPLGAVLSQDTAKHALTARYSKDSQQRNFADKKEDRIRRSIAYELCCIQVLQTESKYRGQTHTLNDLIRKASVLVHWQSSDPAERSQAEDSKHRQHARDGTVIRFSDLEEKTRVSCMNHMRLPKKGPRMVSALSSKCHKLVKKKKTVRFAKTLCSVLVFQIHDPIQKR